MNQAKRLEILEILSKQYQFARIELHYQTPFQLLLAVMLSAQATDISVNKVTKHLFLEVKEPEDILEMGLASLTDAIKTIGLYNAKAKNAMGLSRKLIEQYEGKVPDTREALMSLPGVGRKTANVVLNELYGLPTIAVDTHIFRVCNRTKLAPGKTPLQVEERLDRCVPKQYKQNLHQWLIQLGRYTCVARLPKCTQCPIRDLCPFLSKNIQSG